MESGLNFEEFSLVSLDFKDNCPAIRSMMRSSVDMYEIPGILVTFMLSKGLMYSRVDEFFMMFLVAKRKDKFPVSLKVLIIFQMD